MDQGTQRPDIIRAFRIIHAALVGGLALVALTFFLVRRVLHWQSPQATPGIGVILAIVSAALLVVAAAVLRPMMPSRRFDEPSAEYWASAQARGTPIFLWAAVEAAGLLGWVGYLLTGASLPAGIATIALAVLVWYRPTMLEGDGTS